MKPTTIIYWTRACLGVVAALISALLSLVRGSQSSLPFMNGITIVLLVYIVTHYVFKALFLAKVEKPSKILTTGIGVYFLTWIVAWIIFYTLLRP